MAEAEKQQQPAMEQSTNLAQSVLAKGQRVRQMVSPWVQRQLAMDAADAREPFLRGQGQADVWATAVIQRFARHDNMIARHQRNLFTFAAARQPQLPLAKLVADGQNAAAMSQVSTATDDWQADSQTDNDGQNAVDTPEEAEVTNLAAVSLPSTASIAAMIGERIRRASMVNTPTHVTERPQERQPSSPPAAVPGLEDEPMAEEVLDGPYSITAIIRERIQRAEEARLAQPNKPLYQRTDQQTLQGAATPGEQPYSVAALIRERIQRATNEPTTPDTARKSSIEAQPSVQEEEAQPEGPTNLAATIRERIQRAQAERHSAAPTKRPPVLAGYVEPPLAMGYQPPNRMTLEHETNPQARAGQQTSSPPSLEQIAPSTNIVARQTDLTPATLSAAVQLSEASEESPSQMHQLHADSYIERDMAGADRRPLLAESRPHISEQATATPQNAESAVLSSEAEFSVAIGMVGAVSNLISVPPLEIKPDEPIEPSQSIQRQLTEPLPSESTVSAFTTGSSDLALHEPRRTENDILIVPTVQHPSLVKESTLPLTINEQAATQSDGEDTDATEEPVTTNPEAFSGKSAEDTQASASDQVDRSVSSTTIQQTVQRAVVDRLATASGAKESPAVAATREPHIGSPTSLVEKSPDKNEAIVQTPSGEVMIHHQAAVLLPQETNPLEQQIGQLQTALEEQGAASPNVAKQAEADQLVLLADQADEESPVQAHPTPLAVTQRMAQRRSLFQYGQALTSIGSQVGAQPIKDWISNSMASNSQSLPLIGAARGVRTAQDAAEAAQTLPLGGIQSDIQQQTRNLIDDGLQSESGQQAQPMLMAGASDALAWEQSDQITSIGANAVEKVAQNVPRIRPGALDLSAQAQLIPAMNIVRHPLNLPIAAELPTAEAVTATSAQLLSALPKRQLTRKATDLDALARQVYPLIKRMLAIERERHPLG